MKSFRVLAMSALTLLTVGWLHADTLPVDPIIKFVTGGHGSTPITCTTNGCETDLVDPIDQNGFLTAQILNSTTFNISAMNFVIPTSNFNQDFTAITDAFEFASISRNETLQQLTVTFLGLGSITGQNTAFSPAVPGPPSGPEGFVPGGTVQLFVFFGDAPTGSAFTGLGPGKEGTFSLATPEPSMLWLSLSGIVGLLVMKRRLRKV